MTLYKLKEEHLTEYGHILHMYIVIVEDKFCPFDDYPYRNDWFLTITLTPNELDMYHVILEDFDSLEELLELLPEEFL